jgi:hypothetical protein
MLIFYEFYNLKDNSTEFSAKFDKEKQFEDEKYSIFEKKSQMTEYSSMLEILDNYDGKIRLFEKFRIFPKKICFKSFLYL